MDILTIHFTKSHKWFIDKCPDICTIACTHGCSIKGATVLRRPVGYVLIYVKLLRMFEVSNIR
jgi:hypothetical protein